jgi:hypothetical protein
VSTKSAVRYLLSAAVPAALLAVAVPASAASSSAAASAKAAAPRNCPGWTVRPSAGPSGASLNAVAATSPGDVWAVGSYDVGGAYKSLIEHWNGSKWTVFPSPNPASGFHTTNALSGVVAISRKNAWAFGFYLTRTTTFRTLIEHWNGANWSVVPSPNSGPGENTLAAAVARSATDIWTVGYHNNPDHRRTLTLRSGGTGWHVQPSPSVGRGDNFLFGVAAAPGGPVWAVGSDSVNFGRTLALRWNGSAWTVARTVSPGDGDRFLQAVAAPAARYALSVGSYLSGNQTRTLAERWTGSGWHLVPSASPAADYNSLQAIAAKSPTSAWAVGTRRVNQGRPFRTLAEHWNGSSWNAVSIPSPGAGDGMLTGLTAVPGGGFWAVGSAGDRTLTEFHC